MQQSQARMDVIGNNIANSNTIGYKAGRADFEDAFSQTLKVSTPGNGTSSGSPALQIGSGVRLGAVKNLYSQGALSSTGLQTDMAISGEGFFIVRDTVSSANYATRAGDFRVDENGFLITNQGMRVQGFSDAALSAAGDVQIDTTGAPATASATATVVDFNIDPEGKVNVRLSDGTQFVRGQILLQKFQDPQALLKEGNNLYSGISAAGPMGGATPTSAAPGSSGLGSIESGYLELSNVDLASEFANLITSQRAFQASARMITTSDDVLQEITNLKR